MIKRQTFLFFILASCLLFGGCATTDTDDELPEDEMIASEEENEFSEEEEEEEYIDPTDEYEEEEEYAEEESAEEEWNGIDPDILEEEYLSENEEYLSSSLEPSADPQIEATDWVDTNSYTEPSTLTMSATQGDLKLLCNPTGSQDMVLLTTRYGCKAYLRNTGEYYGIIKGWWRVTRTDGIRVRIKDLVFRDGDFDATFSVSNQDAIAGIDARPR